MIETIKFNNLRLRTGENQTNIDLTNQEQGVYLLLNLFINDLNFDGCLGEVIYDTEKNEKLITTNLYIDGNLYEFIIVIKDSETLEVKIK